MLTGIVSNVSFYPLPKSVVSASQVRASKKFARYALSKGVNPSWLNTPPSAIWCAIEYHPHRFHLASNSFLRLA